MPRIIVCTNQKGGVGKTTTVVNLGAALAEAGKRVLCVDIDPQANCTSGFGFRGDDIQQSSYDLLVQPKKFSVVRAEDIVLRTSVPGLDLIPSHINLAGAELEIASRFGRETLLRKSLLSMADCYDYVFIDTPPSLSLLTVNALVCASEVMVIIRPEPWSMDGVENLLDTIEAIRAELNPHLQVSGIVATMVDTRATLTRDTFARIDADPRLAGLLFHTHIRRNVALAEASGSGSPVQVHAPKSHGAEAYRALAGEVLALVGESLPEHQPLISAESWETMDVDPDSDISIAPSRDEEESAANAAEIAALRALHVPPARVGENTSVASAEVTGSAFAWQGAPAVALPGAPLAWTAGGTDEEQAA